MVGLRPRVGKLAAGCGAGVADRDFLAQHFVANLQRTSLPSLVVPGGRLPLRLEHGFQGCRPPGTQIRLGRVVFALPVKLDGLGEVSSQEYLGRAGSDGRMEG